MDLETVANGGRVLAGATFLYVWVRWAIVVRWGKWWDTRALFILFSTIWVVILFAVANNLGYVPVEWLPWVAAIVWIVVSASGVFLAVGFEFEQRKAKQRRRDRAAVDGDR
jgi:uncharacterized membrane protein